MVVRVAFQKARSDKNVRVRLKREDARVGGGHGGVRGGVRGENFEEEEEGSGVEEDG